jgi:hypothetical protein
VSYSFLGTLRIPWSDGEGATTLEVVVQADKVLAALRELEAEYGRGVVQRLAPVINGVAVLPRRRQSDPQ